MRTSTDLLTERQREILRLLAEGKTSKEIGKALKISRKTVETHRDNIRKRLQVDTISELVQCAILLGIIEPHCKALCDKP
ncbi:MAG: LuxR C-terminal-related transcriptional regulator [Acidobacteriota bacterium]